MSLWSLKQNRRRPPLPPANLVDGMGPGDYWQTGEHTVALIAQLAGIRRSDRVLDVGCGLGRIAWPLSHRLGPFGRYVGFDAAKVYVDWCAEHLQLPPRRFEFFHADVRTPAYNVNGSVPPEHYVFTWPPASFDLVIAISIFTHLLPGAAQNYMAQISRSLRSGGRLFSTYFLLDEAGWLAARTGTTYPTFSYPIEEGLLHDPDVPEDGIAYEPSWVARHLERHGLQPVSLHAGYWKAVAGPYYQDIVVARKV